MYSSQGDNPKNGESVMSLPVIDKATSDRIKALLERTRENKARMNKLMGKKG